MRSASLASIMASGYVVGGMAQLNLYPDDLSPSPVDLAATCIAAINATVSCDSALMSYAFIDYYGPLNDTTIQLSICNSTCGQSLVSYRENVIATCGSNTEMEQGFPVTYMGDLVWNYYNLTCMKDPNSGAWCTDHIGAINETISTDTAITDLSTSDLCSPCVLSLMHNQQSTSFSGYDNNTAQAWASIQSLCDVSYPTAPQGPAATPSSLPGFATSSYTGSCLSGTNYTVKSGDTCEAIATSNSVATGTLITVNQLDPGCSDLQIGQVLCLPQVCSQYVVQSGDTCDSIAGAYGISLLQLQTWNPTLNQACTNLISSDNICVGIPGNATWTGTTIAGVTATQTGVYATTTVAPPGATASGTTSNCGKYYQVQSGDFCQVVALNNTITVELFESINPSINANCSNLQVGLYYCVFPTADWDLPANSTSAMTTVSPPAPTASGTTSNCYAWYTVQSGDSCYSIEQSFDVTFATLQSLNPALNSTCGNLILGDAYCVSGASSSGSTASQISASATATSSSSSSSAVATTSSSVVVTPPAPTTSGTTTSCYEWYTIQSGDYCYLVEQKFDITFAQLQAWNPAIDASCDNLQLGDAYCVDGPAVAS